MIEEAYSKEDAEEVIRWMQAPANRKPLVHFNVERFFERLMQADRWLFQFMSPTKVVRMMLMKYEYSEATARRDVQAAQRVFGELKSHVKSYYAKMMIEHCSEMIVVAMEAKDQSGFAKASKELREWMGYADTTGEKDPRLLLNEVPREYTFDPSLLNRERNPNILSEVQKLIEEKTGKPFKMPEFPEARYEQMPDGDGTQA